MTPTMTWPMRKALPQAVLIEEPHGREPPEGRSAAEPTIGLAARVRDARAHLGACPPPGEERREVVVDAGTRGRGAPASSTVHQISARPRRRRDRGSARRSSSGDRVGPTRARRAGPPRTPASPARRDPRRCGVRRPAVRRSHSTFVTCVYVDRHRPGVGHSSCGSAPREGLTPAASPTSAANVRTGRPRSTTPALGRCGSSPAPTAPVRVDDAAPARSRPRTHREHDEQPATEHDEQRRQGGGGGPRAVPASPRSDRARAAPRAGAGLGSREPSGHRSQDATHAV